MGNGPDLETLPGVAPEAGRQEKKAEVAVTATDIVKDLIAGLAPEYRQDSRVVGALLAMVQTTDPSTITKLQRDLSDYQRQIDRGRRDAEAVDSAGSIDYVKFQHVDSSNQGGLLKRFALTTPLETLQKIALTADIHSDERKTVVDKVTAGALSGVFEKPKAIETLKTIKATGDRYASITDHITECLKQLGATGA